MTRALAHAARLDVFFFLVRARREVPAGEVQAALEIPGRFVYYSTRPDTVSQLVRLLTACC